MRDDGLALCPLDTTRKPHVFTWPTQADRRGWFRRVVVSNDGRTIATGHGGAGNNPARPNDDYSVRLWDLKEAKLLARFDDFRHSVFGLAFTPDSRHLFAVSLDGSIHLYDVAGRKEIWSKAGLGSLYDIAVSRGGKWAATGDSAGQIRLWQVNP